jgi:SynChlorMet cassette protein ScmC
MSTLEIGSLSWEFVGDKSFIKKLTDVMNLENHRAEKRIVVFRERNLEDIIDKYYPSKKGWKEHGNAQYMTHNIIKDILVNISREKNKETDFQSMKGNFFFPIYREIVQAGGLIIHSVLLRKGNEAVLLAGQNHSGKSKCAKKVGKPWEFLSDDISIYLDGRVYPFPTWSYFLHKKEQKIQDKWEVNRGIPLKAIFFLEKTDRDKIVEISKDKAYSQLMEYSTELIRQNFQYLSKEELRAFNTQLFNNCMSFIKFYSTFILQHSLHGDFIKEIEGVI